MISILTVYNVNQNVSIDLVIEGVQWVFVHNHFFNSVILYFLCKHLDLPKMCRFFKNILNFCDILQTDT